ncbi:MAG: NAD(P)-dependent alcohol dehydrogenase [Verrucomicrobiales bacterium]|nr:NAD(P)-dependent alcohol dehydrogenase [Verrucomicrobiales bacterium]
MTTVHAYAATESNGKLNPFEYELGDLDPHQVDITVESCGICHSDLSMLGNEWGLSKYPFVPGHEVSGKIAAVGESVTHLSVGDTVGLGWHSDYCMTCDQCMSGNYNCCPSATGTIVGRHGGFADVVRAAAASVVKLPDELNTRKAGPLFCGGITVFNPFVQLGISPTDSVAVLGIGGLGHLAIQFAKAWGCQVTALTSPGKEEEAKEMGAHEVLNSRDPQAIKSAYGKFDVILSTINVPQEWNTYLNALKPQGKLHFLGAVLEPLNIGAMPLIGGQRSVSGSPVGSPVTIRKMLEFSARHQIEPITEHFPMSEVNEAIEHLKSGDARYRVVLDR